MTSYNSHSYLTSHICLLLLYSTLHIYVLPMTLFSLTSIQSTPPPCLLPLAGTPIGPPIPVGPPVLATVLPTKVLPPIVVQVVSTHILLTFPLICSSFTM